MVIDCFGTCGISKPSASAQTPVDAGAFDWVPVNAVVDRPSLQELPMRASIPTAEWQDFVTLAGQYCPGNLDPAQGTQATQHRCYEKCYAEGPCAGSHCFCAGFIPGYDTKDSKALCLEQQQCEYLCAVTPGCHSVDMHTSKTRCYLNAHTCDAHVKAGTTMPDADYNVLVKPMDDNERRLLARGRQLSGAHVRSLLAAEDPGVSWGSILRFKDVEFTSGGEFKLCFCDSSMLTAGNICSKPEDFTVEVGSIHATGLQCLLSNPKMTRGTCQAQYYNGLRCYDGDAPDVQIPAGFLGVPNPSGHQWSSETTMLMGFCQFAPAEQAAEFPYCAQWREDSANEGASVSGNP